MSTVRGEGVACFMGWKMLQTLNNVIIKNWICEKHAQPVGLGEKWPGAYVVVVTRLPEVNDSETWPEVVN